MLVRDIIRLRPGGAPAPNGTQVTLRKHSDNSVLGTATTANGWFTFELDGSPGAVYYEATVGDELKRQSSKSVGPAGPIALSRLPYYFHLWNDGVIQAIGGALAVTASGTGMSVTVADGGSVAKGILYDQPASRTVAISAADPTNPRIDRVIIEVRRIGSGEDIEGLAERKLLVGTPAASPISPPLIQSTVLWQIPLATVRVDAGVSAISADKVTDQRVWASPVIGTASVSYASVLPAALGMGAGQITPGDQVTTALAGKSATSHTHDTRYVPHGYWSGTNTMYLTAHQPVGPLAGRAIVANRLYFVPILFPNGATSIDRFLFEVMATPGSVGNVWTGLYSHRSDFFPDTRLWWHLLTNVSSAGLKTANITPQAVEPGWYWMALVSTVTISLLGALDEDYFPAYRGGMHSLGRAKNLMAYQDLTAGFGALPATAAPSTLGGWYLHVGVGRG